MNGKIIGNYKIEQKLGEGGMGAVYKGVDTMLDREVAIKVLRPELASQTSIVERFRSEAVTLAKLHHSNIAALYSLLREGNELYMVLEFVRGETLERVLQRRGALPVEEVIPVFCQILDGINHAHEYGIVHRDIKPANMMLTERGTLKVLDFGIARLLGSARMTRVGAIIGTLEYMAPEQIMGQETDARSDIYALGMMLYEMLTGRTPFVSENEFVLIKLQTEAVPVLPGQINPSIPEEVEAAIMRAIEKDPDRRFQTAGEFRDSLLDAGFAAQGRMRSATTGNREYKIEARRPSQPENNRSGFGGETEINNTEISSNVGDGRFAAPAFVSEQTIRETRLNDSNTAKTETSYTNSGASKTFFDNLTWIHYAGAGLAATVLLGLLVIVPIFMLGGSGNNSNIKPDKTPGNKPAVVTNTPEANSNTDNSSSISEEDKYRLFYAAGKSNDQDLILKVSKKVGILDAGGLPTSSYKSFVSGAVSWAMENTAFVQTIDTPEKARDYVNSHLSHGSRTVNMSTNSDESRRMSNVAVNMNANTEIRQASNQSTSNGRSIDFTSNSMSNTSSSNSNGGDAQLLNTISSLLVKWSQMFFAGNKRGLNRVLDDSFVEYRYDYEVPKRDIVKSATLYRDFKSASVDNTRLVSNDGTTATFSCTLITNYNDSNTAREDYTCTAVNRNGTWLLSECHIHQ